MDVEVIGSLAAEQLKNTIERVERLEADKAAIAEDIKEVYAQAKAIGLDPKIIRKVVAERKKDAHQREEQLSLFDIYWDAAHGGRQEQAA